MKPFDEIELVDVKDWKKTKVKNPIKPDININSFFKLPKIDIDSTISNLNLDFSRYEIKLNLSDLNIENNYYKTFLIKKSIFEKIKDLNQTGMFSLLNSKELNQDLSNYYSKRKKPKPRFTKLKKSAENKIVVMTEVVWGTLGDYYAAEKFIRAMKDAYPKFKIQWIIMNHKNSYLPDNAGAIADSYVNVSEWENLLLGKDFDPRLWLRETALVFQFPTFHFLAPEITELIQDCVPEDTQIVPCLEYDYSRHAVIQKLIQGGLGGDAIGIFIDDWQVQPAKDILKSITETTVGKFLLENTTPETYQQSHLFFFAYFNKELDRVNNSQANAQNFCDIIITYAEQQNLPQQNLDIVCRMTAEQAHNFNPIRMFLTNVNRIELLVDGRISIYENPNPTSQGRTVRIYSAFPFPTELFQQLMHLAYQSAREAKITPLIGCTGDQSLSEVLSLPGAIPFYQIMEWKQLLFNALKDIAKNHPQADIFLEILTPGDALPEFVEKVSTALCNPDIQKEWSEIHEFILRNKNLCKNLPKKLFELISNSHPTLDKNETTEQCLNPSFQIRRCVK